MTEKGKTKSVSFASSSSSSSSSRSSPHSNPTSSSSSSSSHRLQPPPSTTAAAAPAPSKSRSKSRTPETDTPSHSITTNPTAESTTPTKEFDTRLAAIEKNLAEEDEGRIPVELMQAPRIPISSTGKKRRVAPKSTAAELLQDVATVAGSPANMPLPFMTDQGFDPWWRKNDSEEQISLTSSSSSLSSSSIQLVDTSATSEESLELIRKRKASSPPPAESTHGDISQETLSLQKSTPTTTQILSISTQPTSHPLLPEHLLQSSTRDHIPNTAITNDSYAIETTGAQSKHRFSHKETPTAHANLSDTDNVLSITKPSTSTHQTRQETSTTRKIPIVTKHIPSAISDFESTDHHSIPLDRKAVEQVPDRAQEKAQPTPGTHEIGRRSSAEKPITVIEESPEAEPTAMDQDNPDVLDFVASTPDFEHSVSEMDPPTPTSSRSGQKHVLSPAGGTTSDLLSDTESGSGQNTAHVKKKRTSSNRDLHRAMSEMIEDERRSQDQAGKKGSATDVHNPLVLDNRTASTSSAAGAAPTKSKKDKESVMTIASTLRSRKKPLNAAAPSAVVQSPKQAASSGMSRTMTSTTSAGPGIRKKTSVIDLDSESGEETPKEKSADQIGKRGNTSTAIIEPQQGREHRASVTGTTSAGRAASSTTTTPAAHGPLSDVRVYAIPVGMDKVVYDLSRERVRQLHGQWLGPKTKIVSIHHNVQENLPPLDQKLTTHIVTTLTSTDAVKKLFKVDHIQFKKPMDPSKYPISKPEVHIPETRGDSPTSETPPRIQATAKTTAPAKASISTSASEAPKARYAKFESTTTGEQIEFDNIVLGMQEGSLEGPEASDLDEDEDQNEQNKPRDEKSRKGLDPPKESETVNPEKDKEAVLLQIINSGKSELKVLMDHYEENKFRGSKEQYKVINYRKAITAIRALDYEITSEEMALKVPRVGKKLAQKIGECVSLGRIKKLDHLNWDVDRKSVEALFKGIYGVGPEKATEWYNQGLRTLDDVRKLPNLNQNQISGLKYYDDLQKRISRKEVEKIGTIVREAAQRLHSDIDVQVTGSYRRGQQDCGDVDIVVTRPDINDGDELFLIMEHILTDLIQQDFLVDHLSKPTYEESMANQPKHFKYMGVCKLPSDAPSVEYPHRHIDILVVPHVHHGAVLIYFTGNDICNRSLRLLAQKRGMSLNDKGLFKNVVRDAHRNKIDRGEWVAGRTEREIFDYLQIAYLEPHEREC
ncbi:hypothetical protein BGZ83_001563 [Gryganskiella cystojenkinii]|nr:hypothetical protein BGZ83_001563 [Gryganskiella cystojenkinii]